MGLPDTSPAVVSSQQMPPACVWQKSSAQLWLNQPANASGAPPASEELAELCACAQAGVRWEAGAWGECFEDPASDCGAQRRARGVWCVRPGADRSDAGGEVVGDSLCTEARPAAEEACAGCREDVAAARVTFEVAAPPELSEAAERAAFLALARDELAASMGVSASRLTVSMDECCGGEALPKNSLSLF